MSFTRWQVTAFVSTVLVGFGASAAPTQTRAPAAGFPTDARLLRAAFDAAYRKDCRAFASREPCELQGDLDGDGKLDRVFKMRAIRSKGGATGIGVAWGDGRYSALGAGAKTPHVITEVWKDEKDETPRAEPLILDGLVTWRLLAAVKDGYSESGPGGRFRYAAPSVVGSGIYVSGGDAAELLYWDGLRWRRLILGF